MLHSLSLGKVTLTITTKDLRQQAAHPGISLATLAVLKMFPCAPLGRVVKWTRIIDPAIFDDIKELLLIFKLWFKNMYTYISILKA